MNSLFPPLDPEEVLKDATGQGVRVAVIDTGLDISHPDLDGVRSRLLERKSFLSGQVKEETDPTDPASHGTPVAWIINQIAPQAELSIFRALAGNYRGRADVFESALRYAVENDYKVINLSLGLEKFNERWVARFLELANKAYYRGLVLVASASNRSDRILPGCISSLISVDMDHFPNPLEFRPRDKRHILYGPRPDIWLDAMGTMIEAPKAGSQGRIFFTGTSFAAPHVSGIVACLLSKYPDLAPFEVKAVLHRMGKAYEKRKNES